MPTSPATGGERLVAPDGTTLLAPLPADVLPGSHFGPHLIAFVLHQYHHNHVTQPLLLEQLRQCGIDISAGQLSRLLTEEHAGLPPGEGRGADGGAETGRRTSRSMTPARATRARTATARTSATTCSPTSRAPTARAG